MEMRKVLAEELEKIMNENKKVVLINATIQLYTIISNNMNQLSKIKIILRRKSNWRLHTNLLKKQIYP